MDRLQGGALHVVHAHLRERLRAAGVQVSYLFWQYRLADRPVSDDVGIHLEQ